jgi:hypothetical protein
VGDLADALREAGHEDVAAELEGKEPAGRLRQSGSDDLDDALEAGEPTPRVEEAEPRSATCSTAWTATHWMLLS